MKKTFILFSLAIVIALAAQYWFAEGSDSIPCNQLSSDKYEPSDQFFFQRFYPDFYQDPAIYRDALIQASQQIHSRSFDGLQEPWAVQGPGNIGARINTLAIHPTNPNILYVGFSQGGAWKTTNFGEDWAPIFDDQPFQSISDITFDPQNPDILYLGTGDQNISGYPFIGNGLYRSEDAGETWEHLGLSDQYIISKIVVDPTNSNIIYVGTMGLPFVPDNNRGLYKSTDGGATWDQILFISDQAGVIDLVINPDNPEILYASGWDRIRTNFHSIVWGEGAEVYQTKDGGLNWNVMTSNLPPPPLGRVGLDIATNMPSTVVAQFVDTTSQLKGIYRTQDDGQTWTEINTSDDTGLSSSALGGFGWYFGKVRVNPSNPDDILLLGVDLWRTMDGGENWFMASPPWWEYAVHADKHDLIFAPPSYPYQFLLATDGGLYAYMDNGMWEDIENIPTTQFYRVAYNPHNPSQYYGGAQDNGSTGGSQTAINEWERIFGGDGFQMAFHATNPDIVLAETQRGGIRISYNGIDGPFSNGSSGIESDDRRNWDMPYLFSHHEDDILYTGTYRVYLGVISGLSLDWLPISPDLTDGIVYGSSFHTISTVHESPVNPDILYAGTSDGNVWRSLNGGTDWDDISMGLPDRYVTDIKASPLNENVVYVTHSGYKYNEFLPRVHRSDDAGDTWVDISADLPDLAVNDFFVLPSHQDSFLFVATDGGVYASLDKGDHWERLGNNMPFIPVYDLTYNVANNELVAGTFARGIMSYSLDSVMNSPPITTNNTIVEARKNSLDIYPNPAVHQIQVTFENIEPSRQAELVILDSKGRVIRQEKISSEALVRRAFSIGDLPAGHYHLKVKMRHTILSGSFVKVAH